MNELITAARDAGIERGLLKGLLIGGALGSLLGAMVTSWWALDHAPDPDDNDRPHDQPSTL